MNMNIKVVEYRRKSTDEEDRQIQSLADQAVENLKLAEGEYEIVGNYVESVSAKSPGKRKAFLEMIKFIRKEKVGGIIAWDAKRLSRNPTESGILQQMLVDEKIFIKTHSNYYDKRNWFMFLIDSGVAAQDIINLSEGVKRGMDSKVRMGHRPGKAPLGYINNKRMKKGEKTISLDNERYLLMRKWFEMVLSGDTVEESLEKITLMGLTERKTSKRLIRPVSRTLAFKIFRNPFYAGKFWWNGELETGAHKPIITWSEYQIIQSKLGRGLRKTEKNIEPEELGALVSLMKCKECGSTIVYSSRKKVYKKSGITQVFSYYRCPNRFGNCTTKPIRAEKIYEQAMAYLNKLTLHPAFTEWCRKVLKRRNKQTFDSRRKQLELQTKRLKEIEGRVEMLITKKIDGWITPKEYLAKKKELLTERENIRNSTNDTQIDNWEKAIDQTLKFGESMKTIFKDGDAFTKRQALRILGSDLIYDNGNLLIDPKYCFVFLKETQDKLLTGGVGLKRSENRLMDSTQIDRTFSKVPLGAGEGSRTPFISLES